MQDGYITVKPVQWKTFKEETKGVRTEEAAINWAIAKSKTRINITPCKRCGVKAENIRMYDDKCEICFHLDLH